MGNKENNRFQLVFNELTMSSGSRILRDKETGVLYFFYHSGNAGGLTPLLDRDGRPMVDTAGYTLP